MPRKNRRSQNEPTVRIVCTSDEEGEESNGPSSGLNLELHDSSSEEDQQLNDTVEMGDNNEMEYVSNVSNEHDLHQGQAEIPVKVDSELFFTSDLTQVTLLAEGRYNILFIR